ncbi:MAG: HAD family hydrolase [Candidatus Paceibacterota bacterium]|jgi:FMN phosphatase YigB (HAD superfamily)
MKTDLIIFDFSGTLAFINKIDRQDFFVGLGGFGLDVQSRAGINAIEAVLPQFFSTAASWQDLAEKLSFACSKDLANPRLPALASFLQASMGFTLYDDAQAAFDLPAKKAILTAGSHFLTDDLVPKDVEIFTPAETSYLKPDPRAFIFVLEKIGANSLKTVMVGDETARDLIPAKSLGMKPILIDRENRTDKLPEGIIKIGSLTDLAIHL